MKREPPLTYKGALQLLGEHDHPWLERIDKILGGVILASPLVAPISVAWGWVSQKDEATSLLRRALGAVKDRLLGTGWYERRELVAAAHTAVVAVAFFEAFEEKVGKEAFRSFELTKDDKLLRLHADATKSMIDRLYLAPVPMPSSSCGFDENVSRLVAYFQRVGHDLVSFVQNLAAGEQSLPNDTDKLVYKVTATAVERYRGYYAQLAADVPEYAILALLSEHGATRSAIRDMRPDLATIIQRQAKCLSALEELLAYFTPASQPVPEPLQALYRANRGAMNDVIVPAGSIDDFEGISFPTIEQVYVTPRYRAAIYSDGGKPAMEEWWDEVPAHGNFDAFLAAHLASPESMHLPTLILGHPGAGKSLLTSILAGRLPDTYVVVPVSLRTVDADAPVYEQIEQSLRNITNGRISQWSEVAEATRDRLRVVILDGLDEMLLASTRDHYGYLSAIAEFQRREADQHQPVAVIVTSRTVVADRVRVSGGTLIVRLEEFDDAQVSEWLRTWHAVNKRSLVTGSIRELTPSAALRQGQLARQPLLLLALALYNADRTSDGLEAGLSRADLYGRLIDTFNRREVRKQGQLSPSEAKLLEDDQLWRLHVTAFAIFNRGRQHVSEEELGRDLAALTGQIGASLEEVIGLAQRAVGGFFLVHTSRASEQFGEHLRRTFEFLHATFGEYLIAKKVISLVSDLAIANRAARRRGGDLDDSLLFAILSHSPLSARASIVSFIGEMRPDLDSVSKDALVAIEALFKQVRNRERSNRFVGYRPLPSDHVRELAVYTANLALLRVVLAPDEPVPIDRLVPDLESWRSTVRLWWSGLDGDDWAAQVLALDLDSQDRLFIRRDRYFEVDRPEIGYAQLASDRDLEMTLRAGYRSLAGRMTGEPGWSR